MKEYPECKECAELTRLTSHAYYDEGYNKAVEDVLVLLEEDYDVSMLLLEKVKQLKKEEKSSEEKQK